MLFPEGNSKVPWADPPPPEEIRAIRSTDGGQTWSEPVVAATYPAFTITDPENQALVDVPSAAYAQAPDGTLYVCWRVSNDTGAWRLLTARSTDGGRAWSDARVVVAQTQPIVQPTIAVARDGTVGVTWYDLREDKPGDGPLTMRPFFAHSGDGGLTWEQQALTDPFDLRSLKSPDESAEYMGGYQGLVGTAHGFAAAFTVGKPLSGSRPGAVVYAAMDPAPAPRLELSVRPRVVRPGRRTAFSFVVSYERDGEHPRVAGAKIRFATKVAYSNRRGRATITQRFTHRESFRPRACKQEFRCGRTSVRVVR